ncbi:MAG: tRNA (adenosine(37)-N6)-threonylcarbamoyltransferase complex dimerization subunit type 1 TsaB [Corynebacterium sp.]|uniref:tRNA (adenosine(37)-N6)-threonylcarbamoyltransferase complex dimerization subunit type 1 TsaB n=1 Tax=Corynebacterium sp. TaxID=1720 RepID=UPI0026DA96E0|nr:tRNA (adenosine(37)-N6)-threonylcarbamoyltransferase complex dimerization subunit type 1 TsaB [Corynebacterium sp.]MDO5030098.1 tRNA (adenosine(37)-N6)-threonylcarbamoyltransferase complex dimerization subunit type 1 TsaB [Corynebacterium sp.]
MNILAVDTSTPQVTAGIVQVSDDGRELTTLAQQLHLDARAHNEVLVPLIQQALADSGLAANDLGGVVVGCGPGPFTGLRVGMATAASYADALGIPCHGICSLDALASDTSDELVVTDARRREVYFTAYRGGQRIFGPAVAKPADVIGLITAEIPDFAPVQARGSVKHIEQIDGLNLQDTEVVEVLPTPESLVRVADLDATPSPLVPLYLRRPDAVVPKAMR